MLKIQITIASNFICSIDNHEEHIMHSKNNIETMMNDKADEIREELFDLVKIRYENNLESMTSSEFVFNYVHLLYHKF